MNEASFKATYLVRSMGSVNDATSHGLLLLNAMKGLGYLSLL